jgi:hypothetical protein
MQIQTDKILQKKKKKLNKNIIISTYIKSEKYKKIKHQTKNE